MEVALLSDSFERAGSGLGLIGGRLEARANTLSKFHAPQWPWDASATVLDEGGSNTECGSGDTLATVHTIPGSNLDTRVGVRAGTSRSDADGQTGAAKTVETDGVAGEGGGFGWRRKTGWLYDTCMAAHSFPRGDGHPECPERITGPFKHIVSCGLAPRMTMIPGRVASLAELAWVHTREHCRLA